MSRSFRSNHASAALRVAVLAALVALPFALAAQQPDSAKAKPKPLAVLTDTTTRYGLVPHRFSLKLGGFLPSVTTTAQFSSPSAPGTEIPLENKLGLTRHTQNFEIEGTWRLGQKQLLTLDYFQFGRSGSRSITDSIQFDSIAYTGDLNASSGIHYYGVTYRYYFWRHTEWELGAGLGLDVLQMNASLAFRVAATGGGGGSFADSAKKSGGFTAPAPMLGIYGDWEFVPRFFLRGTLQYLYINSVESYGGYVSDDRLAVEWYPLHNYGFGLGYHYIDLGITKTFSTGQELKLNYQIQGAAFYLSAAF
jgi:hypothetical protein